MFRRRRPLLRTAAVGGVAYAAGHHGGKKSAEQQQTDAQQNHRLLTCNSSKHSTNHHHRCINSLLPLHRQPAPPATPTGLTDEGIAQLKQLGALHESGVLTDAEFGAAKQKILGI